MAENEFKFGRGIIPEGEDSTIIRRNFQSLALLIDRLEKSIPFMEDTVGADFLVVKGATARTLVEVSLKIDDSGATADKSLTISASQTDDRTITFPDATDTLVGKATVDTLTNKTIDADGIGNSITNIENADIKAAAAIDPTKIAGTAVIKTDFNTQTILAAAVDDTPVALTVGEQTLVGRITSGNVGALTGTQALTIVTPLTTRGDIMIRNATVSTRLPVGTVGQVLTSDGTDATWAAAGAYLLNIVEDVTPQLGADLDCNTFSVQFDDATGIEDDSGNELLRFQKTASAVNHIDITNAATGNGPIIEAEGETNVALTIKPKGTGVLTLGLTGGDCTFGETGGTVRAFKPATNANANLGTDALEWNDLWLDGTAHIDTLNIRTGSVTPSAGTPVLQGTTAATNANDILIPISYGGTVYYVPGWLAGSL